MPVNSLPIVPAVPDPSVAPVLIPVTVLESPESESVSLVKMSLTELFVTVKVVLFWMLIVLMN